MLKVLKISGASLEPHYQEGDFVLVSKIPFLIRAPRPGDTVVFRQERYGRMIKLVERVMPDGRLWVVGSRASSVDSYEFGPIKREDVEGVVFVHIRKKAGQAAAG